MKKNPGRKEWRKSQQLERNLAGRLKGWRCRCLVKKYLRKANLKQAVRDIRERQQETKERKQRLLV